MLDDAGVSGTQFEAERFLKSVTLRQIRYFVAAAEFGKVNTAAAMIAISPSAITEAISDLEGSAGVRLFERLPRGLALTQDGRRFLAHCRRILAAVKDASYAFRTPENASSGAFTLAASSTVVGYYIAPLVARFQLMFPHIETRLVEGSPADIVDGLQAGDVDVAVAVLSNIPDHAGLTCQTLVRSARRLWLPPKHPLLRRSTISLGEIAELSYIQLTIDGTERSTTEYWAAHGLAPNVVFRTESVEAVRSLIAFGHGVTILSDMMYRPWSLEGDRVEVREVAERIPSMDTGLIWRGDQLQNAAADRFQAFCYAESLPKNGGAG